MQAVGVGTLGLATDGRRLVTYGIGSCVAVTAWDRRAGVGGMSHFMLPGDDVGAVPAAVSGRYASVALPRLVEGLVEAGAELDRLVVCAVGGAAIGEDAGFGRIGERNVEALRRWLSTRALTLAASVLGGTQSRSMDLDTTTGTVGVRVGADRRVLWHPAEGR